MRWLLASPLRTLPPLGLVAVGAVVGAAGVPIIKKTARSLAVMTVRGVLTVNDAVKDVSSSLSQGWQSMAQEARSQQVQMDQQTHHGEKEPIFSVDESRDKLEIAPVNNGTQRIKATKKTFESPDKTEH